ncbi:hypothetical protein HK099_006960 [Clydaea vesicula]|uniref:L domain-like protein n=1 Tax=Clydaea vesicula TaxID=447962 RepID=A0AAD5XYS3_9FUNG|nr:hypothetical protein HK099_006960 [Clydaea vesicula]KAJ3386742.1 hypothetical protein HDU92_002331 [Lobulomyces angularis]
MRNSPLVFFLLFLISFVTSQALVLPQNSTDCSVLNKWQPQLFAPNCCQVPSNSPFVKLECNIVTQKVISLTMTGNVPTGFVGLNLPQGSSIPAELGLLTGLQKLVIQNYPTQLAASSNVPDIFQNLTYLNHVDLSNNSLSGPIPPSLFVLPELTYMILKFNKFSGSLPSTIILPKIQNLDLQSNAFTGEIPPAISSLTTLTQLTLSQNQFSGQLPPLEGIPQLGNGTITVDNGRLGPTFRVLANCSIAFAGPSICSAGFIPTLCGTASYPCCKADGCKSGAPNLSQPFITVGPIMIIAIIIGTVVVLGLIYICFIFFRGRKY